MAEDAASGRVTNRTNFEYAWPESGRQKTTDLAVKPPGPHYPSEVWTSCEIKVATSAPETKRRTSARSHQQFAGVRLVDINDWGVRILGGWCIGHRR